MSCLRNPSYSEVVSFAGESVCIEIAGTGASSSSSSPLSGHARGMGKTYKDGCSGVIEAVVDDAMVALS